MRFPIIYIVERPVSDNVEGWKGHWKACDLLPGGQINGSYEHVGFIRRRKLTGFFETVKIAKVYLNHKISFLFFSSLLTGY
jgi:hypothetical protein